MESKTIKAFLYYIGFFWGVTWRTFLVAILAAVTISFLLAYLQVNKGWPPEAVPQFAAMSGVPVAIMSLAYVFFRRGFVLKDQLSALGMFQR